MFSQKISKFKQKKIAAITIKFNRGEAESFPYKWMSVRYTTNVKFRLISIFPWKVQLLYIWSWKRNWRPTGCTIGICYSWRCYLNIEVQRKFLIRMNNRIGLIIYISFSGRPPVRLFTCCNAGYNFNIFSSSSASGRAGKKYCTRPLNTLQHFA